MIDRDLNPDFLNAFLDYSLTILNKSPATVKEYNYDNSELVSNVNLDQLNKNYTMVETVVFDKNGSLWLFNSSSDKTSLIEITKEGEWIHHHKKEFLITGGRSFDNVVRATFDSNGLL